MPDVLRITDLDGSVHSVTRAGLFYSYGDRLCGLPLTLLADAAKIPDYGRNLKRPKAIMDRVRLSGQSYELRYDAGHGRRYKLCCYRAVPGMTLGQNPAQERRIVIAAADGIMNLRQYQIACGVPVEELDAMIAKEIGK